MSKRSAKEYFKRIERRISRLNEEIDIEYKVIDDLRATIGINSRPDPNENVGKMEENE